MSKDIRSFFNVLSKTSSSTPKPKKPTRRILDSDDEADSPSPVAPKRNRIDPKINPKVMLTPINIEDAFPKRPIKQGPLPESLIHENTEFIKCLEQASKPPSRGRGHKKSAKKTNGKKPLELGLHDDDEFDKLLSQVELPKTYQRKKSESSPLKSSVEKKKSKSPKKPEVKTASSEKKKPDKSPKKIDVESKNSAEKKKSKSPKKPEPKKEKRNRHSSTSGESPKKRKKLDESDLGPDTEEEKPEKKKWNSFQMYQSYLQRAAPKNYGVKTYPKGKPDCLQGLCFIKTGVLDSLEHEEFNDLIVKHGGRTVSAVSRKVNFVVIGEEPGPSKLQKAKDWSIPTITEDQMLDMILERSGQKARYVNGDYGSKTEDEKPKKVVKKVKVKGKRTDVNLALTAKYQPTKLDEIIGQKGSSSCVEKLRNWLRNWTVGDKYKCALLSGPPGIGKTTTAHLVAKDQGFDVVELNASDTRNKKMLHNEVGQVLNTNAITEFSKGIIDNGRTMKRVLIMDEVDGMSGNEDRGGIQELIQLIKKSKIPIICLCNDRQHQKLRSLAFYCLDLRFPKPRIDAIKENLSTICQTEGIQMSDQHLIELITSSNCDIRQSLNQLEFLRDGNVLDKGQNKKDVTSNIWDTVRQIFTATDLKTADRFRLFYNDYSFVPLFVQENYLQWRPAAAKTEKDRLRAIVAASDAISCGDLVERKIRTTNNWSLLESAALYACVVPSYYMGGPGWQINFPAWLGHNSTRNKNKRILSEISCRTRKTTSGGKAAIRMDYVPALKRQICGALQKRKMAGIPDAIQIMQDYNLLREDLDNLQQIQWKHSGQKAEPPIDSKVKAAFTRAYNKQVTVGPVLKTSKKRQHYDGSGDEDVAESDDDSDSDNINKDTLIKVKSGKKAASSSRKKKAHH